MKAHWALQENATQTRPGARSHHTLTFFQTKQDDSRNDFVFLFGGRNSRVLYDDCWVGHLKPGGGCDWRQLDRAADAPVPQPRCNHTATLISAVKSKSPQLLIAGGHFPKGLTLSSRSQQSSIPHPTEQEGTGNPAVTPSAVAATYEPPPAQAEQSGASDATIVHHDLWRVNLESVARTLFPEHHDGALGHEGVRFFTKCKSELAMPRAYHCSEWLPRPRIMHSSETSFIVFAGGYSLTVPKQTEEETTTVDSMTFGSLSSRMATLAASQRRKAQQQRRTVFCNALEVYDPVQDEFKSHYVPPAPKLSTPEPATNANSQSTLTGEEGPTTPRQQILGVPPPLVPAGASDCRVACRSCGMTAPYCIHTSPSHVSPFLRVSTTPPQQLREEVEESPQPPPSPLPPSFPGRDAFTMLRLPTLTTSSQSQVRVEDKLFLFGGEVSGAFFDTMLELSVEQAETASAPTSSWRVLRSRGTEANILESSPDSPEQRTQVPPSSLVDDLNSLPHHRAYHVAWPAGGTAPTPDHADQSHAPMWSGLFVYGGFSRTRKQDRVFGDVWYFDTMSHRWLQVSNGGEGGPGPRASAAAAWWTRRGDASLVSSSLVFGGDDGTGTYYNDLWSCEVRCTRVGDESIDFSGNELKDAATTQELPSLEPTAALESVVAHPQQGPTLKQLVAAFISRSIDVGPKT